MHASPSAVRIRSPTFTGQALGSHLAETDCVVLTTFIGAIDYVDAPRALLEHPARRSQLRRERRTCSVDLDCHDESCVHEAASAEAALSVVAAMLSARTMAECMDVALRLLRAEGAMLVGTRHNNSAGATMIAGIVRSADALAQLAESLPTSLATQRGFSFGSDPPRSVIVVNPPDCEVRWFLIFARTVGSAETEWISAVLLGYAKIHSKVAAIAGSTSTPLFAELECMLSPTQRRVLPYLLTDLTEIEIARRLFRSRYTIHDHARAIYVAAGVPSRIGFRLKYGDARHSIELKLATLF